MKYLNYLKNMTNYLILKNPICLKYFTYTETQSGMKESRLIPTSKLLTSLQCSSKVLDCFSIHYVIQMTLTISILNARCFSVCSSRSWCSYDSPVVRFATSYLNFPLLLFSALWISSINSLRKISCRLYTRPILYIILHKSENQMTYILSTLAI